MEQAGAAFGQPATRSTIPAPVAHELVHIEQRPDTGRPTLLARATDKAAALRTIIRADEPERVLRDGGYAPGPAAVGTAPP